jgi:hypothetical protein
VLETTAEEMGFGWVKVVADDAAWEAVLRVGVPEVCAVKWAYKFKWSVCKAKSVWWGEGGHAVASDGQVVPQPTEHSMWGEEDLAVASDGYVARLASQALMVLRQANCYLGREKDFAAASYKDVVVSREEAMEMVRRASFYLRREEDVVVAPTEDVAERGEEARVTVRGQVRGQVREAVRGKLRGKARIRLGARFSDLGRDGRVDEGLNSLF